MGVAIALALVLASCSKREPPTTWHVVQGEAPFLMRGAVATLRGKISAVRADLQIDFSDVTRTRGTVSFDLSSLKMTSYEDLARNAAQTKDAAQWLGVAEDADPMRWGTYVIRAITSAEPRDLTRDSGQRRTRLKATGDLTLHGHTAPCEALLEATVAFEGARGRAMHLRTVDDISVPLAAYEVIPPLTQGEGMLAEIDRRIVGALAGTADVALDLALEPAHR